MHLFGELRGIPYMKHGWLSVQWTGGFVLKKKFLVFLGVITILLLLFLLKPYVMVHHLTKEYGSEFCELYSENGFYSDIEYLKVFQYRDKKADIYYLGNTGLKKELSNLTQEYAVVLYVEENHSSASIFIFYDENGQWKLVSWSTVWSSFGTADGFMFPCYF